MFAVHPLGLGEPQLRQLLGLTLPDKSIAATSILADLAKKYRYTGHYLGYFDTGNFAETLLDELSELNSTVLARSGFDSRALSETCKQDIRQLAGVAPRVVFGYEEIGEELVSGNVVVELREDLTAALQSVAAVVPGLGAEQDGLLSFGLSANLPKWREFFSARLDALQKDPYECEYLERVQEGADQARALLNQPLPPVVYGIRGFNAVLESLSKFDFANPQAPKQLDGSLVLAVDDAPSLVAMGALFSGELANLDLKPNGVAVELKLQQLDGVAAGTFVALQDDALAIAFGDGAKTRAGQALKAKMASPPPVFAMSMDSKRYYEFVASNLESAPVDDDAEGKSMSPEAIKATRDMLRILGETYERVSTDARFTERGLEIRSRVQLADF
jgi:hypothetical protein